MFLGVAVLLVGVASAEAADVPARVKQLSSKDNEERRAAAKELGGLGETGADGVGPLSDLIKDAGQEAATRQSALAAVRKMGKAGRRALPAMVVALKSPKGKGNLNGLRNDLSKAIGEMATKDDTEV